MSNSEGNNLKTAGTKSVFSMISKPQNGLLNFSGMWNLAPEMLRDCSHKSLACKNKYLQGWAENPEVLSAFSLEARQNQGLKSAGTQLGTWLISKLSQEPDPVSMSA